MGQLVGPALELDEDRVDTPATLHVQVGVERVAGGSLDADHVPELDVLLELEAQVLELLGPVGGGTQTLGRHQRRHVRHQ